MAQMMLLYTCFGDPGCGRPPLFDARSWGVSRHGRKYVRAWCVGRYGPPSVCRCMRNPRRAFVGVWTAAVRMHVERPCDRTRSYIRATCGANGRGVLVACWYCGHANGAHDAAIYTCASVILMMGRPPFFDGRSWGVYGTAVCT